MFSGDFGRRVRLPHVNRRACFSGAHTYIHIVGRKTRPMRASSKVRLGRNSIMFTASHTARLTCLLLAFVAGCASRGRHDYPPGSPEAADDSARRTIEPIEKVWQARAPGLSITRTPEGRLAVQLIGGPTSFYSSNAPLYLVDDVPFEPGPGGALSGINPYDIESIKVL